MELCSQQIDSPLGTLLLLSDGAALHLLEFADCEPRITGHLRRRYPGLALRSGSAGAGIAKSLSAYFAGDIRAIDTVPVGPRGRHSSAPYGPRSARFRLAFP